MSVASISVDTSGMLAAAQVFERAGTDAPKVIQRALNRVGDMAKTKIGRVLVQQTALPRKTIVKALVPEIGPLSYSIKVKGGDVRVKFFNPKETDKGVVANPWNTPRVYTGSFMKQGFHGHREDFTKPGMKGHVWNRVGKSRKPIEHTKSGLFIPKELVTGASEAAFQATVGAELPKRLTHELSYLLGSKQ